MTASHRRAPTNERTSCGTVSEILWAAHRPWQIRNLPWARVDDAGPELGERHVSTRSSTGSLHTRLATIGAETPPLAMTSSGRASQRARRCRRSNAWKLLYILGSRLEFLPLFALANAGIPMIPAKFDPTLTTAILAALVEFAAARFG